MEAQERVRYAELGRRINPAYKFENLKRGRGRGRTLADQIVSVCLLSRLSMSLLRTDGHALLSLVWIRRSRSRTINPFSSLDPMGTLPLRSPRSMRTIVPARACEPSRSARRNLRQPLAEPLRAMDPPRQLPLTFQYRAQVPPREFLRRLLGSCHGRHPNRRGLPRGPPAEPGSRSLHRLSSACISRWFLKPSCGIRCASVWKGAGGKRGREADEAEAGRGQDARSDLPRHESSPARRGARHQGQFSLLSQLRKRR